jgi:hypothetical protein
MKRGLLLLCCLSSICFGQVEGPFTVWEGEGLPDQHGFQVLAVSDSSAHVFYQVGTETWLQEFDVRSGEVIGWPRMLASGIPSQHYTLDDAITFAGSWALMINDSSQCEGWLRVLCADGADVRCDSLILSTYCTNGFLGYWYNTDRAFAALSDSEFVVSWSAYSLSNLGGFWCAYSYFDGWVYNRNYGLYYEFNPCRCNGPSFEYRDVKHVVKAAPDSLLTLTYYGYGVCACSPEFNDPTPEDWCITSYDIGPTIGMVNTPHGRWFFVTTSWADYYGPHDGGVYEVQPSGFTVIDTLPSTQLAAAGLGNLGLTWVTLQGSGLYLQRLDTSGVLGGSGVLHWPDANHEIISADMSLSDEGKIYVLWNERVLNRPGVTRLRIAALSWETPLAVDERVSEPIPSLFSLVAYPNPFNSELRIRYELERVGEIELAVYNVLGELVEWMDSGVKSAGVHERVWSPRGSGGIYFVRLSAGSQTVTEKVLYLK